MNVADIQHSHSARHTNSEQRFPIHTVRYEKAVNKSHAYINQYHILRGVILRSYM